MTTATKITIARILLVPYFATQVIYYVSEGTEFYRITALVAFLLASLSDALDGYIARRYNQHSQLGAILDPVADKLLLITALVLLSLDNSPYYDRLPLWLAATVISRELILILGCTVIYYFCGRVEITARFVSKAGTTLQIATVLWVLLKWPAQWVDYWAAATAVITGIAGIQYIYDGVRQLSASPASAPTPKE